MNSNVNLYEVLEVSPRASPMVIRAAYRYLAQFHHPDKRSGAPDAGDRLVLINHAYSVLSDPEQRTLYDQLSQREYPAQERRGSGAPETFHARRAGTTEASRPFGFRPLR